MIGIKRIGHATFETPDVERQLDYYTGVVGLVLLEREKDRAILVSRLGDLSVILHRGSAPKLTKIAFQVSPHDDLAALAKTLTGNGIAASVDQASVPGIGKVLTFQDPKGTTIEVFTEARPAGVITGPTAVGPLKLGHIAFMMPDIHPFVEFYQKVLGFRVSDWRDDTFAFLRCGVDHHTVNFVIDTAPKLHHIAFEVADWAELHRSNDFLAKNDVRLVWGPGRHIIGHNIAAYHRNSDDVRVELFCEMDQMKDEALGYFDPRPWHQDRPQRPKTWPKDTLRNYWGFGSHGTFPGYP